MPLWLSKTTADGRWEYGYGEYAKNVATMIAGNDTMSSLYKVAILDLQYLYPTIKENTLVPTYYIWAKAGGQTFTGGEWNLLTGGKNAMLKAFAEFEQAFAPTQNDAVRINTITLNRLKVQVEPVDESDPAAQPAPPNLPTSPGSGGGYVLPLVIGAVALFLFLR